MSFWTDWSDGKKWIMGIVAALVIAAILGGVSRCSGDNGFARKEIIIAAQSLPAFAVQSEFSGRAILSGRDINVQIDEATISYPRPTGALKERRIDRIRVSLVMSLDDAGSWEPVANSPFYTIDAMINTGETKQIHLPRMHIPLDQIPSVTNGWLVFEIIESAGNQQGDLGSSNAHNFEHTF